MFVAYCIPIHGWSEKCGRLLRSLVDEHFINGEEIIVTNSDSTHPLPLEWRQRGVAEISVGSHVYWSGAVARLYGEARARGAHYVALLNHDCTPEPFCLQRLLAFASRNPRAIAHAVLVYEDRPEIIWWAGSKLRWGRGHEFTYTQARRDTLPSEAYATDAMMGQCIVLPITAADGQFLHQHALPHYFSDSVQTSEMRRRGFQLFILPTAVARSDQSDADCKRKRIRPATVSSLLRGWIAPYSSRNLRAAVASAWYHQDTVSGKIMLMCIVAVGKLMKPVLEFLRFRRFL